MNNILRTTRSKVDTLKKFSPIKIKNESRLINSTAILEIEPFIEKKGFKTPITKPRNRY